MRLLPFIAAASFSMSGAAQAQYAIDLDQIAAACMSGYIDACAALDYYASQYQPYGMAVDPYGMAVDPYGMAVDPYGMAQAPVGPMPYDPTFDSSPAGHQQRMQQIQSWGQSMLDRGAASSALLDQRHADFMKSLND